MFVCFAEAAESDGNNNDSKSSGSGSSNSRRHGSGQNCFPQQQRPRASILLLSLTFRSTSWVIMFILVAIIHNICEEDLEKQKHSRSSRACMKSRPHGPKARSQAYKPSSRKVLSPKLHVLALNPKALALVVLRNLRMTQIGSYSFDVTPGQDVYEALQLSPKEFII